VTLRAADDSVISPISAPANDPIAALPSLAAVRGRARSEAPVALLPSRSTDRGQLRTLLNKDGPLAAQLPGFVYRPEQVALAEAVEQALAQGRPCLAEAGTGIGKTLAYLVPLVRWLARHGGRAVVSTHTLALQAQLIERDIPTLLRALPDLDIRAVALKGRSNFLCLQDLDAARGELWTQGDPKFQQIRRWASETDTGDVAELDFSFPDWSEIAANADTCRQRECRFYERCFYFKARKGTEEANLLVVNHALFFADLRLRRANPGAPSLLPQYDAVVFDEAHHVEDMAVRAFGLEFGSRRVSQLVARARACRWAAWTRPGSPRWKP
jgi:ATP-dependent DNA helicase DinG